MAGDAFRRRLPLVGVAILALVNAVFPQDVSRVEPQIRICNDNMCMTQETEAIPKQNIILPLGCHTIAGMYDDVYGYDHDEFIVLKNDEKEPVCCCLFEAEGCGRQDNHLDGDKGGKEGYRYEWFYNNHKQWRHAWRFRSYGCIKGKEYC